MHESASDCAVWPMLQCRARPPAGLCSDMSTGGFTPVAPPSYLEVGIRPFQQQPEQAAAAAGERRELRRCLAKTRTRHVAVDSDARHARQLRETGELQPSGAVQGEGRAGVVPGGRRRPPGAAATWGSVAELRTLPGGPATGWGGASPRRSWRLSRAGRWGRRATTQRGPAAAPTHTHSYNTCPQLQHSTPQRPHCSLLLQPPTAASYCSLLLQPQASNTRTPHSYNTE